MKGLGVLIDIKPKMVENTTHASSVIPKITDLLTCSPKKYIEEQKFHSRVKMGNQTLPLAIYPA